MQLKQKDFCHVERLFAIKTFQKNILPFSFGFGNNLSQYLQLENHTTDQKEPCSVQKKTLAL